jgi:hypothetical protein
LEPTNTLQFPEGLLKMPVLDALTNFFSEARLAFMTVSLYSLLTRELFNLAMTPSPMEAGVTVRNAVHVVALRMKERETMLSP